MAKNDRRVRYTKQVIKNSLFQLLETTPLEQITVKTLCEKADINRATFYSHYETLNALLDEIGYEECKELFDLLDNILMDEDHIYHSASVMIQFLKDHTALRQVFLNGTSMGEGMSKLMRERLKKSVRRITAQGKINQSQVYWLLAFIVYGLREILRQWFASDMIDEDEFIRTLTEFIRGGLSAFV